MDVVNLTLDFILARQSSLTAKTKLNRKNQRNVDLKKF